MKTYILFHLNLFFSSVEIKDRKKIINNCYEPLLELSKSLDFKIGVEASGLTIEEIQKLSPKFLGKLKKSLIDNQIEFIGSGYSQSIGPLIPYEVNLKNFELGKKVYREILDIDPKIALVNEMTFSKSIPDILIESGYESMIMDVNNLLHKDFPKKDITNQFLSINNKKFNILWSDFNLFQKFQQLIYQDISFEEYKNVLQKKLKAGPFPIYSNDAEIFDFRPGRFSAERPIAGNSEWKIIHQNLKKIQQLENVEILDPSMLIKVPKKNHRINIDNIINSPIHIPVKKQPKYNLSRWSVTGINDPWINSICYKILKKIKKLPKNTQQQYWKKVCYFWSSDFRTHLTKNRWKNLERDIRKTKKDLKIKENNYQKMKIRFQNKSNYKKFENLVSKDGNKLEISTKKTKLTLNLRRGLAIDKLSFKSNNFEPILGTIKQGYFDDNKFSADFYSNNFVADLPIDRIKLNDLLPSKPFFRLEKNILKVSTTVDSHYGEIRKEIGINLEKEEVSLTFDFSSLEDLFGSVNAGNLTFFDNKNIKPNCFFCKNGGKNFERFSLNNNFDHSEPASFLVSSNSGLGCTDGVLIFARKKGKLLIKWSPENNYIMPKIQNIFIGKKRLTRVFFSLQEVDDTKKEKTKIGNLKLLLSS